MTSLPFWRKSRVTLTLSLNASNKKKLLFGYMDWPNANFYGKKAGDSNYEFIKKMIRDCCNNDSIIWNYSNIS